MAKLQSIKGMKDILPADVGVWQRTERVLCRVLKAYGYHEIRLPLLEKTELFARSIGEDTDIVGKEMYTFSDRDGESLTLRPEGTAGCIRAGLQHGIFHNQQARLYYLGPMFRHERPQRGRYRQFHQIGVEAVGWEGPDIDAELLLISARFWKQLGIDGLVLEINCLGDIESRRRYREKLLAFLAKYEQQLDNDSKKRLKTNPLRVLDSKDENTQLIVSEAPNILESLDAPSRKHFDGLQEYLDQGGIRFRINPRLVRGLDYYSQTVFEWITGDLGAQGTVCAGGRYDGLVEQLGGKSTPAVGFALGLERLVELASSSLEMETTGPDVYLATLGDPARQAGITVSEHLRDAGLDVIGQCGEGGLKNQLKRADRSGACVAVLLGQDELDTGTFTIKPLRSDAQQSTVTKDELVAEITRLVDAT